jgi:hypothetical protein
MNGLQEGSDLESAIRFTRHNFDNLQSMIRLADAKAAGILTVWILILGSSIQMGHQIFNKFIVCQWTMWNTILTLIMVLLFVMLIVLAIIIFYKVIFPKKASHYKQSKTDRDLMYFEHILNHETQESYRQAIWNMNPSLELRNLCDQVYELSDIVNQKMTGLQSSCKWLLFSVITWVALAAFYIFIY